MVKYSKKGIIAKSFLEGTLMKYTKKISWTEFLERYLIYNEEFMFKWGGREYWLAFSDDKNGKMVAELNVGINGNGVEWYEYSTPEELLDKVRINGFTIKELWDKF